MQTMLPGPIACAGGSGRISGTPDASTACTIVLPEHPTNTPGVVYSFQITMHAPHVPTMAEDSARFLSQGARSRTPGGERRPSPVLPRQARLDLPCAL